MNQDKQSEVIDMFDANSKGNRDCLAKAKPGEPMFIILGRDPDGANIVQLWAERRSAAGDPEHGEPVKAIAQAMREWAADPAHAPDSAPEPNAYPTLSRLSLSTPSEGVIERAVDDDGEPTPEELARRDVAEVFAKHGPAMRAAIEEALARLSPLPLVEEKHG